MATVWDWLRGMTQVIDAVTRAVRGSGRSRLLVVCGRVRGAAAKPCAPSLGLLCAGDAQAMMLLDSMKVSAIGSSTGFSRTLQPRRRPEHGDERPAIRLISVTPIAVLRLFPRNGSDL